MNLPWTQVKLELFIHQLSDLPHWGTTLEVMLAGLKQPQQLPMLGCLLFLAGLNKLYRESQTDKHKTQRQATLPTPVMGRSFDGMTTC